MPMPITLHWRLANVNGTPGPTNTVVSDKDYVGIDGLLPSTAIQINLAADPAQGQWIDYITLASTADPEREEVARLSHGGRPNPIPASFFIARQNELADPATHPHIMGITHTAVRDGFFDDPATWDTGTVPGTGAKASTGPYHVRLRGVHDQILDSFLVAMGGRLSFDKTGDTRLRLYFGMSMGEVDFYDTGHSTTPGKAKHEIIFHPIRAPGATTELGWMFMGPSRVVGAKKESFLRVGLSGDQVTAGETAPAVRAGATRVYLPGLSQSGWRVGQIMMFGGTHLPAEATSDPQYTGPTSYFRPTSSSGTGVTVTMNKYLRGQEEQRTITGFDGDWALFAEPLVYGHAGYENTLFQGQQRVISPVVGNPSHNIEFRTASAAEDAAIDPNADLSVLQKRAHLMFHGCEKVDVRYISCKNMARTSTDPTLWVSDTFPVRSGAYSGYALLDASGGTSIHNPNNVRGRYGIHFHFCGGQYLGAPMIPCVGVSVWAPLDEVPIPGWGMTQHGTRMAMENCFGFNVRGAAFVSELGMENGQWVRNLAMHCRGDGDTNEWNDRHEQLPNHNGASGVGFDNQSRIIRMHDNIAVSCRIGYLWHFQKNNLDPRAIRDIDLPFKDAWLKNLNPVALSSRPDEAIGGNIAQIPPFIGNECHAVGTGFEVIHRVSNWYYINGEDNTPMLVEDYHCLNVTAPFRIPQYSNFYYLKDCLWKSPTDAPSGDGAWLGDVTWTWNFSNMCLVNYAIQFRDAGAGLNYNGFFMDIKVVGGGAFTNAPVRTSAGLTTNQAWNAMGDAEVITADSGVVRRYRPITAADLPQPYPAPPLGVDRPSGYPVVTPGQAPYFILGNGVDQEGLSLTLTPGNGRNNASIHGIVVDSVGAMRWPDWQSSESDLTLTSVKGPRNMGKLQPEQLVQRFGCWNDGTVDVPVWKTRAWWFTADRYTHVRTTFYIDFTLSGFDAKFLSLHDIGGPGQSPVWPDSVEQVPPVQAITPLVRTIKMLSRTRLEAVSGQTLKHRLRYTAGSAMLSIVGGANAADFRISGGELQWAAGGTRATGATNTYEVTVRVRDVWGNQADIPHTVLVVPSARVSAVITDNFNRADEIITANPAYIMRRGDGTAFTVTSNVLRTAFTGSPGAVVDFGSLGTSEQEILVNFTDWNPGELMIRMVDENNYIGIRRRDEISPAGVYVRAVIDGVANSIGVFRNQSSTRWLIRVTDDRLVMVHDGSVPHPRYPFRMDAAGDYLEHDALTEPGVIKLPSNAPRGTFIGAITGGASRSFIDNLTATALPS